jgi:hypothetical protein
MVMRDGFASEIPVPIVLARERAFKGETAPAHTELPNRHCSFSPSAAVRLLGAATDQHALLPGATMADAEVALQVCSGPFSPQLLERAKLEHTQVRGEGSSSGLPIKRPAANGMRCGP